MKTLLTDKYDLMAGTVDKITKVLFDDRHGDSETVAQVLAIIAEHEQPTQKSAAAISRPLY